MLQRKMRILKSWKIASDKIRYAHILKMEEQLQWGGAYTHVQPTDELTGVLKEKIPCRFMRLNTRKKFKSGIVFGFPVVLFTYVKPGRETNWVVLLKVPRGIHTDNPDVI